MALTPEHRQQMLLATREVAAAFVEDLAHVREALQRPEPSRAEIRLLSNVLRRFLIDHDGDIRRIAPPRTGRLHFSVPDNNAFYRAERPKPYLFFGSGGAEIFGVFIRCAIVESGHAVRPISNFNPEATAELSQDGFLSQKVLCLKGNWANRRDVISFVANTASGVHSGSIATDKEKLLAAVRNSMIYGTDTMPDTGMKISTSHFDVHAVENGISDFFYRANKIDAVLFELMCAAFYFVNSPKVIDLEQVISLEIGLTPS